jgi:hypothetical protein
MSIEFSPAFRGTGAAPVRKKSRVKLHGRGPRGARATRNTKPVSARRVAANRANARKSTGPRTAAGKRRVSRNALKHGMCALYGARLPSECEATFEIFCREIEEDLRPTTTMQRVLFAQIVNLLWRLERLAGGAGGPLRRGIAQDRRERADAHGGAGAGQAVQRRQEQRVHPARPLRAHDAQRPAAAAEEFDRVGKRQVRKIPTSASRARRPAGVDGAEAASTGAGLRASRVGIRAVHPPRDEYEQKIDAALWFAKTKRRKRGKRRNKPKQSQAKPPTAKRQSGNGTV